MFLKDGTNKQLFHSCFDYDLNDKLTYSHIVTESMTVADKLMFYSLFSSIFLSLFMETEFDSPSS